ncbi:MAG: mannitol dehydrogenase family protein [Cognatishimia sp.]
MMCATENMQSIALSDANLPSLPKDIPHPNYDRTQLRPGIVHIGVGNFHRAHQAWYLHQLMQNGLAHDWAIIGAGVRSYDAAMRERLVAQDCLTTLIEVSAGGPSAEVVGSMIDYLPIEEDCATLIRQMADPAIRIVSLTVTEGGYFIAPTDGGFELGHPDIQHDVAHPEAPRTAFGAIVAALNVRRQTGAGAFTVLSCDNLRGNGTITRQTVVSLARQSNPGLADWISAHCSFPNSMVDCIVPATGPSELDMVRGLGIEDAAPVTHESYRQWVIEDDFCAGRPELEEAGAILTDDVHNYEAMKIRILNAGHQVLANVGELLSVDTIAQCMAHPLISEFFHKVEHEEIVPYVAPVPDMSPADYTELIASRFSNPEIRDTTRRVAFDGSSRHPEFILPILKDALVANGSVKGLALVEALWARMCAGVRDDGSQIQDNDPIWPHLSVVAKASEFNPKKWLEQRQIYGNLADDPVFASTFCHWLELIWSEGSASAVEVYLGHTKTT